MSISSALLSFARSVVQSVISQVTQQMNVVQEQAYDQVKAMVAQTVGGAWRGQGADAFVNEINTVMLPQIVQSITSITAINSSIQFASEVIDRADEQVSAAVNTLADTFSSIY
ncbi:MAG: hypothetical protein AB1791_10730 [Chloroflexota bacterium]